MRALKKILISVVLVIVVFVGAASVLGLIYRDEVSSLLITELNKKICASCHPFATTATFSSQLRYLLQKDFIKRESRGIYQITETGKKYLEII